MQEGGEGQEKEKKREEEGIKIVQEDEAKKGQG